MFNVASPDSTYAKPFLTIPEQVHRLRARGMECGPDDFAFSILERYGYYRLSGYWHQYRALPEPPAPAFTNEGREIRLDEFIEGASLAHVVSLYDFDHELRARLSDVLSAIEISFRFYIGHRIGRVDKFAHRSPGTLDATREVEPPRLIRAWNVITRRPSPSQPVATTAYREWLAEYDRHEKRARDGFVLHFREKYGPHLPIWVATEVMSFGVLSNLYGLMRQVDQEVIAARFQVYTADGHGDRGALANWLNNLRNVRNICAHYGRVWNRTFDVLIDVPGQSRKEADDHLAPLLDSGISNKLYGVLIILRHLLYSVAPERADVIDILNFIAAKSQMVPFDLQQLGVPEGWRAEPIWDPGFALDPAPMRAASLLDRTECLTAAETRDLLWAAEVTPSGQPRTAAQEVGAKKAAQRKLLRTYLRYNVVIEVEIGGTKHYPAFQFREGLIIDPLAEINQALAARCVGARPEQIAEALLGWWQTPHPALPNDSGGSAQSPVVLLHSVSQPDFLAAVNEANATSSFVTPVP